ncbi:MAG: SRPBCC family protein [Sedimentisphaerales bacterium]|nr:SRPBCC family protein [Sedimentisphaerales bacterium]
MGNCYNSTVVNAPREKVWDSMKDFHNFAWAESVITKVEIIGEKTGTEIGAKRLLNDAFLETLVSVNEDEYTFTYSIDDGPEPLSKDAALNYLGAVRLYPVTDTNTTFVEWTSSYESDSEQVVADFCNPIYAALLGALKSFFS